MRPRFLAALAATVCALAAGILGTAPVAGATTSSHKATTLVVADCFHAQYEPKTLVITCSGGGTFFMHLSYSSWTATTARGTGQLWINTDPRNPFAGHYAVSRAAVVLDRPVRVHGHERFSRVQATWTRAGHRHHVTFRVPFATSD